MNISEVRSKFPQYKDLSDKQLADALHEKFYPDIPLPEFYEQVGYSKKGLGAAVSKGAESLISQARTGISSLLGGSPEEAAKAGISRGKDIGERYAEQTSLDKVIKAYKEKGILPAAGEVVSQIPAALAEQAPNIAALAGSARAGAALGSIAGPTGALIGGLAGAAVPSLLTQFGGNIERQAEEQTARGEPVKINREKAGFAAVPQAALDVAGNFIPLGGRLVSKLTGIPEKALLGGGANAAKLAEEKLLTTLAKGTATGALAEIPTEVAQQMLERSQAGLSLTSDDALREYGQTAYQVGLLAPMGAAGRLSERGGARQQVEQEKQIAQRKARMEQMGQEEEAQRVQAEEAAQLEARKQTPEYATEFVNNYEALDKQFRDLKAIKRPGKGASFEEIDAYKAARAQLKEIGKQLAEQVGEYRRVKGAAQQAQEQRYANIEQQAAQEVPQGPTQQEYYQSAQGTLPGMEPVEVPEEVKPSEQVEDENKKKVVEFAQKQQELERLLEAHQEQESNAVAKKDYDAHEKLQRQGNLLRNEKKYVDEQLKELGGYKNPQEIQNRLAKKEAEFADMAGPAYDPEKAKKLREEIQALKKEAGQEQLGFDFGPKREFKNQFVESKEAFKARAYEPGPQEIEDQEREYLDNVRKQEDEATAEAERNAKLAPERNAMMRMQERRGPFTLPTGQVSTQVDKLVDSILTSKRQTDKLVVGRVMEGMGAERVSQADSLRAQLSYALATNNSTRAQEIRKQLADLREPDTEQGAGQLEIGLLAKETGVEGKQTPDTIRANRATRLAQAQLTAFDRLSDFIKRIREDSVYRSDARIQTLRNAAERLKDTVIGLALNEIDAKRVIAKLPPLSIKEKTDAVGNLEQVLTELIERGAGIFEPLQVKTTQAQMRANKVVRGAEEEISRAPLGQRVFNNYDAAAKALRSQMRDAVDEASGIEAPAPREQGNAKVTKVTPILKTQFQGQTRSTEQQFEAALNRASEEDTTQLELLQKYFKNLSPESQDLVLEQVRRVENGLALEMPRQLEEDLKNMRGAVADEGAQNELFPGASEKGVTRTTSKRFMNFLDSGEVNKLRASIAEDNRQVEFQAKRAATIARKIEEEQKRIDAYNKKLEESKKNPVEAARATLTKITAEDSAVTTAIKIANNIRKQRMSARQRIGNMVSDLETAYFQAKKKLEELEDGLDYVSKELLLHPYTKKIRAGFEFIIKDIEKHKKIFNSIEKALEQARATQKKVLEEQAGNTIDKALINEGDKAERKLEAAKEAVRKAQNEETVAKNKAEAAREAAGMPAKEPGTPTIATILERTPGSNKTIVIRDTLNFSVQNTVNGLRGAIGKYENAYEKARIAGDKAGMEAAAKAVENSYNKIYNALDNAPQKITSTDEFYRKEQEAMEEFDEAQRATLEATMKQMYEESGIRPLRLSTRKVEGVVKTKTGRIQTAIKEPNVAEQERQFKLEKAEGKVTPLEQIAVKKVELAAAQKQIDYIANNPSATAEGRKKQATAKKEAVAKRNDAKEELRKLTIEQQAYVRDAKLNKEAAKATFKEERKILKNAEKAPESQLQDDLIDDALNNDFDPMRVPPFKPSRPIAVKTLINYPPIKRKEPALKPTPKPAPTLEQLRSMTKEAVENAGARKFNTTIAKDHPLHGLTFEEAARYGAQKTTSPMVRQLFNALAEVFSKAPIMDGSGRVYMTDDYLVDGKMRASGIYTTSLDVVYVNSNSAQVNKVLLHELTHAATVRAMNLQPELMKQMDALRLKVVDWLATPEGRTYFRNHSMVLGAKKPSDIYGLTNAKEFVAELFANREFQKLLTEIPSDKPRKSIFTRFVEALSQFFNMPAKAAQSLFAETVALTEEVLNVTREQIYEGKAGPLVFQADEDLEKGIGFSRGSTDNPSTVSIVNQELKKHFTDLGRIKIYSSVNALLQSNPQYKDRIPSNTRGFVDTAGNKVFLIAENINQGQALGVLLHEVGAHVGLKNILGKEQYDTLSSTIESWAKRNDNSVESRIAKEAIARVDEANTPASQRSDEILAYAVEEAVKAGVTPNKIKGVLGEWLSKIADSFRKLLQKFGMRPESLDAQGLVDMAFGAAQMEMQPTPSGMSRRAFLRGAVAAVGGMQLPAVNMGMSLDAKAKLFNATLNAADSWFSTAIGMAKTPALRNIVKQYSFDIDNDVFAEALYNADSDIEGKESLYSHLHWESYGNGDSTESLIDLLKSKPDAVEKLQAAVLNVRSQLVATIDKLPKKENGEIAENELPEVGELLFSVKPKYVSAELAAAGHIADQFVAKQKNIKQRVQAASGGWLGLETQFVDRFAGFEKLSKLMEPLRGSQMMFYLRMYDQRMNFVAQSVARGAPQIVEKIRADGKKEYLIEATEGDSLKGVVETLKEATPLVGNGEAVNRLFTLYMSAVRVKDKGIGSLNFNGRVTEADLAAAVKAVENTPGLKKIFEAARHEYNGYNKNLINFLVQTGAISKEHAANLLKENDYIPWYRQRNGVAELVIGSETPVRIGSIAEQPYLQELVGGDEPILDFMTSSVQNTNMLADMGLRNLATKNAVFELANMGLAKIGGGRSTSGPDVVKFKDNGQDKYALIDTDQVGIPADILVKGMEGIPTQMPAMMRLLAAPAQLLRKAVTLSPLYAAKQLFRDSVAAPLLAGADFTPVMGAIREIGSPTKEILEKRGITGGQIFTGTSEDLTKILKDITAGRSNWSQLIAKAEAINMEADAATRRAQYNSYIKQGLSEMEATLMSLESMNFNKRGASPSVHWMNAMIPFFNAQIQSMNVLYKALTGKLPFNERLKIQEKLLTRGLMVAAGTLAYANMMQDDEAYKNATPEQKYGNWFIRIPGVDEPIRLPIPFEIGYIFKALPEALYNTMKNKHGGEEAVKAFEQILLQTIPGGTSYGIPQALRPAIEAGLGKSFYTGRDTLTPHEAALMPEYQFRANTTEVSKLIGKVAGVSPIKLDELIRGYTGTMGLAFAQAVSMGVPTGESPEKAYKRLSETPVVGGLFQPNDAGGIITSVYDKLADLKKLETTVDDLITKGEKAEAMRLVQTRSNDYMMASMSDYYTSTMRDLTAYENAIRSTSMSGEDKRSKLDEVRQMKIRFANTMRENLDKTTRQSALP